jgi:ribonuclease G
MKEQKLLLTHYKGREAAFLLENDRLIQVMLAGGTSYAIGDIYVGRVKNIVKGMDAAFVELSPQSVGFLPFSHFNPKTVLNRENATQIKCGDELLVQISKEPHKTKEATLTTDISFSGRYLVLIPYSQGIHYSKKFDGVTKQRLRDEISEVVAQLFGEMDVFLQH